MIHAAIDVAKLLPRKGPRGWASKAWMSRADQSLTSTMPKRCSATSPIGMGSPIAEDEPSTTPTSSSKSSAAVGWRAGGASPRGTSPDGRRTGVPLTTTVPDRPW